MHALPDARTIWEAARSLGLDPRPVQFESVPAPVLYEFAAYVIPGRMSHWSYGKAFWAMKTRYDYGLAKLYEMVINSNPALAFLLESNTPLEDVFVMAHVMGHVDFFTHNRTFEDTPEDMPDRVARHADRIRQYEFTYGQEAVEHLLDAVLSVQEHVDRNLPEPPSSQPDREPAVPGERDFSDLMPEPAAGAPREVQIKEGAQDLLAFVAQHSTELEDWQRDVVEMVREEMLYLWPQIRTKIMNEGWATFWHARLMRVLDLDDEDATNFARLHSSVLQPPRLGINPYLVGYRMWERIADVEGDEALWLTREVEDDTAFIRNHLDRETVESLDLYTFSLHQDQVLVDSTDFKHVRQRLAEELTHGGIPVIHVEDGDYNRRGELYLQHRHEGRDLDLPFAERTLQHIHRLWGRPVHLETRQDGRRLVLTYDGRQNTKVVI
jgi:stage V sporulation protein R